MFSGNQNEVTNGITEGNAEAFIDVLIDCCRKHAHIQTGTTTRIFKFCVRHIEMQRQSYQLLLSYYLRDMSRDLYISAPSILATSRGVGPLGRQQLIRRLERELAGKCEPTVGYDLRANRDRSAALGLLDILTVGDRTGNTGNI